MRSLWREILLETLLGKLSSPSPQVPLPRSALNRSPRLGWLSSSRKKSLLRAQRRDAYRPLGTSATAGGGGGVGVEGEDLD